MTAYPIADPAVEEAILKFFDIGDMYLDMNQPTYIVEPRGAGEEKRLLKQAFKGLVGELRSIGYLPRLRRKAGQYVISVMNKPPHHPPRHEWNFILLGATAVTIFIDGFFFRSNIPILTEVLMPNTPAFVNAVLFTISILGIFGLHEIGHKTVALLEGVEASMPFFLPAPPGMGGTFGAVITQKEPPTNRDALFDLGLSGPLIGFLVTIIIAIIGMRLSFLVPSEDVAAWSTMFPEVQIQTIPFPLLLEAIASVVRPTPEGMVMMLHPVSFAAWVGCIVTFINLIPAWQLDGGHITRAILGGRHHRKVSMAGIALMIISGFYVMAFMLAFFMMRSGGEHGAPLDDISPLSLSRKLLFLFYIAMIILTMVSIGPI